MMVNKLKLVPIPHYMRLAERSDSVGRALDWILIGLLVRDSRESLCCVLVQDTLFAA